MQDVLRPSSSPTAVDDAWGRARVGTQHAGCLNATFAALGGGETTGCRASGAAALSARSHTANVLGLDAGDTVAACAICCFMGCGETSWEKLKKP